jgi:hypothetical protein
MRRLTGLLAGLISVAGLVVAPSAHAASSMDWVPENQLTTYRALAAQYADASALGPDWVQVFDVNGITCIADPAGNGAMGIHFVNPARLTDGKIDASQPEAVVYEPRADGKLHLVAFEYLVFQSDFGPTPPELFPGHPFMSTDAPNRFGLPPFYSQHVWIGKGNPNGNLAMWNPNVHCG